MGKYKRIYPSDNLEKQTLFDEYLVASQNKQAGMLADTKFVSSMKERLKK